MRNSRILVLGLICGFVAAFSLTGCTGQDASNSSGAGSGSGSFRSIADLGAAVNDAQQQRRSARLKMEMAVPRGPEMPTGGKMTGDGAVKIAGEATETAVRLRADNHTTEMVILDDAYYIKQPKDEANDPDKPWLKIDPNAQDPMSRFYGLIISQQKSSTDTSKLLDSFENGSRITETGKEKVHGQHATHYRIVADVRKLAGSTKDEMLRTVMRMTLRQGIKRITHDLWVNGENLPVRYATEQPQAGGMAKVQVDFLDWGKPVDISAPPDNRIGEPPQLGPAPEPGGN